MTKNIKKSLKYIAIITGVFIILPVSLFLVLQVSEIQTFIIKKISNRISREVKSTISIGKVKFEFFNRLIIDDLLILDQNADTMIYAQKITTGIRNVDFRNNSVRLGRVYVIKPVIGLITDSTGMMNLTWYLDKLKNETDTIKNKSVSVSIDQIDIIDAVFSLKNLSDTLRKTTIDFNNLSVNEINGTIEKLIIDNDTTSFNIHNLSFNESSGINVKEINSSILLSKNNFRFNNTHITSDSSIINFQEIKFRTDSSGSFKRFVQDVDITISIDKSLISSYELQYFLPFTKGINESIWLSGNVSGTISELRGRNIIVSYRDYSHLDCDFDISGLPDINNAFIYLGINRLTTNAIDISKITLAGNKKIGMPGVLYNIGNISFDGSFTGFITDFVTYGELRTRRGVIRTDLSMRPEDQKKYRIRGLLTGIDINLGEITGNPELFGKLNMQSNIDGYAYSLNKFAANLTGKIDSVEIKKYNYRDIDLNGFFTEKTWDGRISVTDQNIKMDLLGLFNFEKKLPEFDFTLNISDAKLHNLNLDKTDTTSALTLLLTSNFKGNSIDNLDGEIRLLNSTFVKHGTSLEMYDFSVRTYTSKGKPVLSLRTDFVDADINGYYNFAEFGNLVSVTLSKLMPSKFPPSSKPKQVRNNNFSFDINFKNTDKINSFLRTGVLLSDKSFIKGDVFPDSIIRITGNAKQLTILNNTFNDFSFSSGITGNGLAFELTSSSLKILRQSELKEFSVKLNTLPDKFNFAINWDNKTDILNSGRFIARGEFIKEKEDKNNSILYIEIDSSDIYARNNLWRINRSSIIVDSNAVKISDFLVGNKDYYYLIDGSVSTDPDDTLKMGFKGIDITPLNYLLDHKRLSQPDAISLNLMGRLNGKILLTNVYKELLLEGNLTLNDFSVLGTRYGTMTIGSDFDITRKVVNINASNNLEGAKSIDIEGYYDPALKKISLTADAAKFSIAPLNPLLRFFASDISGTVSGKVNLSGEAGALVLKGAVLVENSSLRIDYLKTKYILNDSVRFDTRGINFNNVRLADEKGNPAILSGTIFHKSFRDFAADIVINTTDCMVLNTKAKDNEIFYGTGFATGVATIKSIPGGSVSFDISAKSGRNTKFYVPLNSGLSVSELPFISFTDSNTGKVEDSSVIIKSIPAQVKKTGMDVNIDLEVTPAAEVQLIFDLKVGDVMKAHGSGDLNINYNKKGEFRITGDYIIEEGDYLFTLRNILNKPFSVENGGRIMFNGDINNAEIDMKAIYKLRASLAEIMPTEGSSERVPVECHLNLSGNLFNPVIGFNIYLPTVDEKTRTYLKNAISTEEQMSKQFLYLLVMNSFFPDPTIGSSSSANSGSAGTAAAVTTSEMLFSQLSNMLSQISNDFDIGLNYRPGVGNSDINPDQLEVALSKQILNDKVVINGNFDVRGSSNDPNTDQITGDFDAEVKITEKVRFKVFNRYNNFYTGKTEPYTQGIGIFFRQDFNKFSDLFIKKDKSGMKKEEEPALKQQ